MPPKPKRGRPPKTRPRGVVPGEIHPTEAGRRLREAREVHDGLTQGEAARRTKLTQARWSEYESGTTVPSWTRLLAIVQRLNLDPSVVFPELFNKNKS